MYLSTKATDSIPSSTKQNKATVFHGFCGIFGHFSYSFSLSPCGHDPAGFSDAFSCWSLGIYWVHLCIGLCSEHSNGAERQAGPCPCRALPALLSHCPCTSWASCHLISALAGALFQGIPHTVNPNQSMETGSPGREERLTCPGWVSHKIIFTPSSQSCYEERNSNLSDSFPVDFSVPLRHAMEFYSTKVPFQNPAIYGYFL